VKNRNKQTPDHAFGEALEENIQGSRHARKFIARFAAALLKTRTSNLAKIANAIESEAEADSVYRQTQRFLKNENKVSIDYLKLLKLNGKLKILIDRTSVEIRFDLDQHFDFKRRLQTSCDSDFMGSR